LTGSVTSAEEGAMEGVLVSAQAAGSPVTVTVVSDEHGRFRFPDGRLAPGHYALRIRAIGYELDGPQAADLGAATTDAATRYDSRSGSLGRSGRLSCVTPCRDSASRYARNAA